MSEKKTFALQAGRPSKRTASPASLMADKAETVRVNFDLARDQHRRLKVMAAQGEKTIADILRELVSAELKKNIGL